MTELLEKAIVQLKTCSPNLQDAIASLILEELMGEVEQGGEPSEPQNRLMTLESEAIAD